MKLWLPTSIETQKKVHWTTSRNKWAKIKSTHWVLFFFLLPLLLTPIMNSHSALYGWHCFLSTSLQLTSTRWVWLTIKLFARSTLSKRCPCHQISAIYRLKKIWEHRVSNPGWLGAKRKRSLCAMPSPPQWHCLVAVLALTVFRIFFLLPTFLQLGLSATHVCAEWLLKWSAAAKWAMLLITNLVTP